jgi:outer membrane protein assembly factor BamB
MTHQIRTILTHRLAFLAIGLLVLALAQSGGFADRIAAAPTTKDTGDDDQDTTFNDGPSLSTDSDVDRVLSRADDHIREKRYDLAARFMQKIIDDQYAASRQGTTSEFACVVVTRPAWKAELFGNPYQIYRSVVQEVEDKLRRLPPEGLLTYRITADGQAKGLIEIRGSKDRKAALDEAVRRFFMSSYGDDAAFELACELLEERDFVGAVRLLRQILERHPDPSVPRDEILLRLAVANSRLGDQQPAEEAMARLADYREQSPQPSVSDQVVELVRRDLSQAGNRQTLIEAAGRWSTKFGVRSRRGVMRPLPYAADEPELIELWNTDFGTGIKGASKQASKNVQIQRFARGRAYSVPQRQHNLNREGLVKLWRDKRWTPAGHMLSVDGLVYFKSYNMPTGGAPSVRIKCYDAASGKLRWERSPNHPAPSRPTSTGVRRIYQQFAAVSSDKPATAQQVMLFGDLVSRDLAVIDGLTYSLVGVPQTNQIYARNGLVQNHGVGTNELFAYDAKTGRYRGKRGGDVDPETKEATFVKFVAAPVKFGDRLIVPVRQHGALYLYAIKPFHANEEGEWKAPTVWKTFLCDEPPAGVSPYATVGVSVDGSDVYVASGAGVVFAVDGANGAIRWATRYKRSGNQVRSPNPRIRYARGMHLKGWDEDTALPVGRYLVVLPSDADMIFGYDRRTGRLEWFAPRKEETRYCLGLVGQRLIIGGPTMVAGIDLAQQGRYRWIYSAESAEFFGRGCVTTDAVFVPAGEGVTKLDLDLKPVATWRVKSTANEPLGNLFSDGDRLYGLGLARVTAIMSQTHLLAMLDRKIKENNDLESLLKRMEIRANRKDWEGAFADLRAALPAQVKATAAKVKRLRDKPDPNPFDLTTASKLERSGQPLPLLVESIQRHGLAKHAPVRTLELLIDAKGDWSQVGGDQQTRRRDAIQTSLKTIRDTRPPGATSLIVRALPHFDQRYLLSAAEETLIEVVTEDDVDILRRPLQNKDAKLRAAAVSVFYAVRGKKGIDDLAPLLDDEDDQVRYAAARALAQLGDRRSLKALGTLLQSEKTVVRAQAIATLRGLTGQAHGFHPYAAQKHRAAAAARWLAWREKEGDKVKFRLPLKEVPVALGRTLICQFLDGFGDGKAIELDAEGKEIFQTDGLRRPRACQGLPNGHRLIGSFELRYVAEFDAGGKEIWRASGLPGAPESVQRLANENTLIACSTSQEVIEVDPGGTVTWRRKFDGQPSFAQRLPNDHTLVALEDKGRVVEIDRAGKVHWEITDLKKPRTAKRLANGNTLVVENDAEKVVEYDSTGKAIWSKTGLRSPKDAQRLPSGNTLIVDATGIIEVDAEGNVVSHRKMSDVSRVHRY